MICFEFVQRRDDQTDFVVIFVQEQWHSPRQCLSRTSTSDNCSSEPEGQHFSKINLPVARFDCGIEGGDRAGERVPSTLRIVALFFRASVGEQLIRELPLSFERALHGPQ